MFGRDLVEDFEEEVIVPGTFAMGPVAYSQAGSVRWWVWDFRRSWRHVPGPGGWRGTSPLPDESQLALATVTGADELTGLAMVHGPAGPAMAILWGPAVEGSKPSSRFPEIWISPVTGDVFEDPDIAHHLRLIPQG